MLWTDADFISATDLISIDPDLQDVADSLELVLTGKTGIIHRGIETAGRDLEGLLVNFTTYISSNDLSANHVNAVFYTGSTPSQRRRVGLEQIVVSGRNDDYLSEIKQWVIVKTLIRFYLAASNRSETDRYTLRYEQWVKEEKQKAFPALRQSGIPIVYRPLWAPAWVQARLPQTWAATAVAGSGTLTAGYQTAITWVDQSRYIGPSTPAAPFNDGNSESNPSAPILVPVTPGNVVQADITKLTPPNGAQLNENLSRGVVVPLNATGWNVYVGLTAQTMTLQNVAPIPVGTKTYALAADPTNTGPLAGTGQYPDQFLSTQNLIQRG